MKPNLIRVAIGLGASAAFASSLTSLAGGCGSSTTTTPPSATDGSSDSTTDVSSEPPDEGSPDVMQTDSSPPGPDAGDAADAPYNFGVDAASIDAPSIGAFPSTVAQAFCTRLASCCFVSSAAWNQLLCTQQVTNGGGFRELSSFSPSLDSGNVLYDASAAAQCIADFTGLPCGTVNSSAILTLQGSCYGALTGTLGVDAGPCRTALECGNNEYCAINGDAGTGFCSALHGVNQPCTSPTSEECSYLGLGNPALFCKLGADGGPGQCMPTEPNEAGCTINNQCQSQLCDYPKCGPTIVVSDPGVNGGTCEYFTIKDAGGGG